MLWRIAVATLLLPCLVQASYYPGQCSNNVGNCLIILVALYFGSLAVWSILDLWNFVSSAWSCTAIMSATVSISRPVLSSNRLLVRFIGFSVSNSSISSFSILYSVIACASTMHLADDLFLLCRWTPVIFRNGIRLFLRLLLILFHLPFFVGAAYACPLDLVTFKSRVI